MPDNPTIDVRDIAAVRVFTVRTHPGTVVIRITTASGESENYALPAEELAALACSLARDAALLDATGPGDNRPRC